MKTLYFECTSGISGDMTVASLIDLGVDAEYVKTQLKLLGIDGYEIEIYPVFKKGIRATQFDVKLNCREHQDHVGFREIKELIEESNLPLKVKELAIKIFTYIAVAEGKIHGKPIEEVHFHEVGAVDSIVDIVAAAVCIDKLAPDQIIFSEVSEGHGFVRCAHGEIPVPAPATLELLTQVHAVIRFTDIDGELVTPTGAGILAAIGSRFGEPCPKGKILKIGYGAGLKNFSQPNILRTFLVDNVCTKDADTVCTIEAQVDDMTGEQLGYAMQKLFDAGCVDVYFTPIYMKKNRPATLICALCQEQLKERVMDTMLRHTSTIGLRVQVADRVVMEREMLQVKTEYGVIDVKKCTARNIVKYHPEYEQVRDIAEKHGISYHMVVQAVNLQLGYK